MMARNCRVSRSLLLSSPESKPSVLDRGVKCVGLGLYDNRRRSGEWVEVDEAPALPNTEIPPEKDDGNSVVTAVVTAADVIHYNLLDPGRAITAEFYCDEIVETRRRLRELQAALVSRRDPILLSSYALPHVSEIAMRKSNELGAKVLPLSPSGMSSNFSGQSGGQNAERRRSKIAGNRNTKRVNRNDTTISHYFSMQSLRFLHI